MVFISEYTGGGFGSKITGAISLIIPGAAVQEMQRSGDDAAFPRRGDISSAARAPADGPDESRASRRKAGSPRSTCSCIINTGPYDPVGDAPTSGRIVSLLYQPETMRFRGLTVMTNTSAARRRRARRAECRASP